MLPIKRLVGRALALVLLITLALPTLAVAKSIVKVPIFLGPPGAGSPAARPGRITYTGDGSGFYAGSGRRGRRTNASRLHWSSWGVKGARASGDNWLDNCVPDCARGAFTPYPVRLRLFRPGRLDGYFVFTRLEVTYTGKRPPFKTPRVTTLHITYAARGGGFNF